jgi:hypothetical protein
VFTPAGKMEAFFREVTKANAMPPQDAELWRAHGMELLGPPLFPRAKIKLTPRADASSLTGLHWGPILAARSLRDAPCVSTRSGYSEQSRATAVSLRFFSTRKGN